MNFVESGFVVNGYFIRDSDTQGKFRFDGLGKKMFVNEGVTAILMVELYSAWCDWIALEDNLKFEQGMRFSGYDPIPGGYTGTTFFLRNGWRLIYDPNIVAVSGVLFSENDPTPFWNAAGNPLYPATVSALVNSSVSYQNVVTGTALTPEETADAVWSAMSRTLTTTPPSNAPTAAENAQAVWNAIVESGLSAAEIMRLTASFIAADATGLDSSTPTFKSLDGTKTRIQGSYVSGTRTVTVRDGS